MTQIKRTGALVETRVWMKLKLVGHESVAFDDYLVERWDAGQGQHPAYAFYVDQD